ncbi:MAG: HlyC/CorC family transporter [Gammaproteobacteria bacterium]|nr:MAG: HlyC/CorC family transporter [Gammaproteobacteria bacterium]
MNEIPLYWLFIAFVALILLSAFFSSSETGLMSLNRYRLKHLADKSHGGAMRAVKLLQRPDKLITLILLGNNFVNVLITQLATYIGYRLYGEAGIALAAGLLTLILLLFAEVTPKTLAATNPEKIALPAAYVYQPLAKILMPLVVIIDWLAKGVLKLFLLSNKKTTSDALTSEELRVAVNETSGLIPDSHRDMMLSILDLEKVTVDDIMVPRNEILGIDLEDDWHETLKLITNLSYTRIPIYSGNIDNLIGVALMRKILPLLLNDDFTPETLVDLTREGYFIPEGTPLTTQLLNFRKNKRRVGFVVDEYGDIQGLVAIEDILEEIVGEFTTDPSALHQDFFQDADGSFLIDGSTHIRDINRNLEIELPSKGPRTLNGLILEHMEFIPEAGTSVKISGYPIEIMQVKNNMVKTARLSLPEDHDITSPQSELPLNG